MEHDQLTGALRETLDRFDGGGEPLTTTEVADRLDLGRRATYERLDRLVDLAALETKKVGASARVWWRPAAPVDERSEADATDANAAAAADEEGRSGDGQSDGDSVADGAPPGDGGHPAGNVSDAQFDKFVESVEEYAIFTMSPEGYIRTWNAGARGIKGYEAPDILGEHFSTFYTDADREAGVPERNLAAARGNGAVEDEGWRVRADGSRFWANVTITAIRDADGDLQGFTKVTRDMTDRRAYERKLKERAERVERERDDLERELEAVFERISDGVYGLDEEFRVTYANEQARSLLGIDDASIDEPVETVVATSDEFEASLQAARDTQESVVTEEYYEEADGWYEYTVYPSATGLSVYVRDVTERKRREIDRRRRVEQQEVIAALGQRALADRDIDSLLADTSRIVAKTLDNDYCEVLDLDDGELTLRAGVGWDEGVVGSATVSATEAKSQAAYTLETAGPVVVEDLEAADRFSGPALLTEHGVRSGISVVIGPIDDPWGILGVHDAERRSIGEDDANFVQAVAAILAAAIARHEDERELVHQREQLAALNNLNEVVRDITDAIIDQSTRDEIERTVCDRLADADSYAFAWIGDVDAGSKTISTRVESGVEGYLDDVTISVDPDDERSKGPTGRAFRTGEIQVTQNVAADERYEPWRDRAAAFEIRSSAAIPIVHEGTTYGVLNVYADRPSAFSGDEQRVIAQIGEVIGHAIAATERKQALMSDEVIEAEFLLPDVFDATDVDIATSGTVNVEHAVARSDDDFLLYGTATADATGTLERLADAAPDWEAVVVREGADEVRFEAQLSDPTILSVIASRGGSLENATIADGDVRLTVGLAPHVDVREFVDAMESATSGVELLSRKQRTRDRTGSPNGGAQVSALTDQQRTSLETAYYAGFFEWPRVVSGEDVAASLDIAPSTFHQHLRKAEGKVLGSVLTGRA